MFKALRIFAIVAILATFATSVGAQGLGPADRVNPAFDRPQRERPMDAVEVPAEIQEMFADGMTAEEFVQMAGYVPKALEGMVEGDALMIIEFEDAPLAVYYAEQEALGQRLAASAREKYVQNLETAQARVQTQLARMDVQVISNYTVAYNGIQARIPYNRLNEIRELPGVKAVHPAPIHEPALSSSVPLIGAPEVWADLGFDGEDVVIAVIDTGIDYTHAAFDGSGNIADYEAVVSDTTTILSGTFPTNKVIAGWDFAGTLYHAGCSPADEDAGICTTTPISDANPIDVHGHGTHVASTAAGVGYEGMGKGVAPAAKLVALKVFGDVAGSTSLTIDALEWATENYIEHGWPHVINMSLGSPFGTNDPEDPSVQGTQAAAEAGIVVVASAGNSSDESYITGSPGAADKAISVASSEDGFSTLDGFEVTKPADLARVHPGLQSVYYDWDSDELPITGDLVYPIGDDQRTGCYTFNITNTALIEGNIVLLDWTTPSCGGSVARTGNAVAAGAIGVLIADDSDVFDLYIAGSDVVPAYSIPKAIGNALKDAIEDGDVEVVMTAEHEASVPYEEPAAIDIISSFSSRGPRGYDSALKPEITAPGGSIFAADVGSGSGGVSMGGTSMAAPHIAGVAALMVQANPDWTPEAVKAAMMNTAVPLSDGTPIPRSGAGRVDAYRAVNTDVYAVGDDDLVSLSWGVIMSRNDVITRVSNVMVYNTGDAEQVFTATVRFQEGSMTAGATLMVEPEVVTVPAEDSAVVTVTLEVDMTQIPVWYGPDGLEEYYGFVSFTPPGVSLPPGTLFLDIPEDSLMVPFYFQPRPYSQLEKIEAANTTITDFEDDYATFTLTHRGPITSSLWAFPALAWNETPSTEMAGPGDVRLFGLDYDGFFSAFGGYGDVIDVAINTHDYWHVPQPFFAEFDLYIDADQDGEDDFVNFNFNYGWLAGGDYNNVWVVVQIDLATGNLYLGSPWLIFTDYNASFMEWYLPVAWQGLSPMDSTFDYGLISYDGYDSVNESDPIEGSFDYANYPLGWAFSHSPGPSAPEAVLNVGVASFYDTDDPLGVMIVDYNGDPRNNNGSQAYFEPIVLGYEASPLTIDKTGPESVAWAANEVLTYTITLTNPNTFAVEDVTVADELPALLTFVDWIEQPAGAVVEDGVINWTGDVAMESSVEFAFTAKLPEVQSIFMMLPEIENVVKFMFAQGNGIDTAITTLEAVEPTTITPTELDSPDQQISIDFTEPVISNTINITLTPYIPFTVTWVYGRQLQSPQQDAPTGVLIDHAVFTPNTDYTVSVLPGGLTVSEKVVMPKDFVFRYMRYDLYLPLVTKNFGD